MKRSITKATVLGIAILSVATAYAKGKSQPPRNVISIESARVTATTAMAGQVQNEQLENEGGKWVYSFDLKSSDSKIHEVQVDAISGKLVSTKAEVDDEANESEDNDAD